MKTLVLDGRRIGNGKPCFVIAEAGVNHNGDVDTAIRLVQAAALARADAVKFQTFRADRLVTASAPVAGYQAANTGRAGTQRELLSALELSATAHRRLAAACRREGIRFLSSPFDEESADFLDALGVSAFKIGSGELTNHRFLAHVARKGKPMIVSTGMATLREVGDAVRAIRRAGNSRIALLHCVSAYPADPATVNLRAMSTLAGRFGVPVGFSDHTRGIEVAVGAAALGACVVEKHFTLDRRLPGPDHAASLEPHELAAMVYAIRTVQSALGDGVKRPAPGERETARVARRSLVAARDIPAGAKLSLRDVVVRRPGTGLAPACLPALLGRRARAPIAAGALIGKDMFA